MFNPAFSFGNNNDMLACLTQGQVQDVFWLNESSLELADSRLPAYFVPKGDARSTQTFYAVVHRTEGFVARFEEPWSRLSQQEYLTVQLRMDHGGQDGGQGKRLREADKLLKAHIISNPRGIRDLRDHVKPDKYPNDVVLAVSSKDGESLRLFGHRTAAQLALKVCLSSYIADTLF